MKSACRLLIAAAVIVAAAPMAAREAPGAAPAQLSADEWFDCAAFFSIVAAGLKQDGQNDSAKTFEAYAFIANGEGVDAARKAGAGGSALEDLQQSFSADHLKPRIKAQMEDLKKDGDAYFDRHGDRCMSATNNAAARLEAERKAREAAKGK